MLVAFFHSPTFMGTEPLAGKMVSVQQPSGAMVSTAPLEKCGLKRRIGFRK